MRILFCPGVQFSLYLFICFTLCPRLLDVFVPLDTSTSLALSNFFSYLLLSLQFFEFLSFFSLYTPSLSLNYLYSFLIPLTSLYIYFPLSSSLFSSNLFYSLFSLPPLFISLYPFSHFSVLSPVISSVLSSLSSFPISSVYLFPSLPPTPRPLQHLDSISGWFEFAR